MRDKKNLFSNVWNMPYGRTTPYHLFDAAKNSKEFVQKLQLQRKIPVHDGCVNSICWNDDGKYLLSGSDDQRLSIVHGYEYSVLGHINTGHHANIFSAKFLPNTGDTHIVSCSGDGIIIFSDLDRPETSLNNKFNCHRGTAYEIITVPHDPNTFLSCGEDRSVRWFDLRTKTSCSKENCQDDVLINCKCPVTSIAINPLTPYQLALGCADSFVRLYDRRMLCTQNAAAMSDNDGLHALMACFKVAELEKARRITSLCYSNDGQEVLVSYSSDYIYLFDVRDDLNKKPKSFTVDGSSTDSDNDSGLLFQDRPLIKRLRIRGDWSDTGPNARPEGEARGTEEPSSSRTTSVVNTMTDILTRMLNTNRSRSRSEASQSSSASSHVSSQSEDVELIYESIDEEEATSSTPSHSEARETSPQASDRHKRKMGIVDEVSNSDSNECDTSVPETSSAFNEASSSNLTSVPSTSCDTQYNPPDAPESGDKPTKDRDLDVLSEEAEEQTCDMSDTGNFENLEKKLESRRRDLIEKHHSEPMVNFHYSGQSVSSGLITMDVASSSTANEQQWLEQSVSDLPELPSNIYCHEQPPESPSSQISETSHRNEAPSGITSSESDTEAGMQSIEPNPNLHLYSANSNPVTTNLNMAAENAEIMMDIDSYEMDSDEDTRTSSRSMEEMRDCSGRSNNTFLGAFSDDSKGDMGDTKKEFPVTQTRVKMKFTGHRNARTMIKESTFWGDNFIMSGSDCGHIFIWDRYTADLVMLMEADHHVVNCLQPHPFDPILASSGIDYDIKLWAPSREEPFFDQEKADEIINRNKIMLEETKDTITVPASFMFRMFSTLSNFRAGRPHRWSTIARGIRERNRR